MQLWDKWQKRLSDQNVSEKSDQNVPVKKPANHLPWHFDLQLVLYDLPKLGNNHIFPVPHIRACSASKLLITWTVLLKIKHLKKLKVTPMCTIDIYIYIYIINFKFRTLDFQVRRTHHQALKIVLFRRNIVEFIILTCFFNSNQNLICH